ncbi:unnamed protein product [Prunus armeniaca]
MPLCCCTHALLLAHGCPKRYRLPENFKIKAQDPHHRFKTSIGATFVLGPTPKNDQKWPEFQPEIQPNFGNHTSLVEIGGRRRKSEAGQISVAETAASCGRRLGCDGGARLVALGPVSWVEVVGWGGYGGRG